VSLLEQLRAEMAAAGDPSEAVQQQRYMKSPVPYHGLDVDLDLLTFAIERNLDDPWFWLRKAIGWALRQHARVDPDWVREDVDSLDDRLSGLSRREATKHL